MKKSIVIALIALCTTGTVEAYGWEQLPDIHLHFDQQQAASDDALLVNTNGMQQVPYIFSVDSLYYLHDGLSPSDNWLIAPLPQALPTGTQAMISTDSCGNIYSIDFNSTEQTITAIYRFLPSIYHWEDVSPSDTEAFKLMPASAMTGSIHDNQGNIMMLNANSSSEGHYKIASLNCRTAPFVWPPVINDWQDYSTTETTSLPEHTQAYADQHGNYSYLVSYPTEFSQSNSVVYIKTPTTPLSDTDLSSAVGGGTAAQVLAFTVDNNTGDAYAVVDDNNKSALEVWHYDVTAKKWNLMDNYDGTPIYHYTPGTTPHNDAHIAFLTQQHDPKAPALYVSLYSAEDLHANSTVLYYDTEAQKYMPVVMNIPNNVLTSFHIYNTLVSNGHLFFYFGPNDASIVYDPSSQGLLAELMTPEEIQTVPNPSGAPTPDLYIPENSKLSLKADDDGHLYALTPDLTTHTYQVWRYTAEELS